MPLKTFLCLSEIGNVFRSYTKIFYHVISNLEIVLSEEIKILYCLAKYKTGKKLWAFAISIRIYYYFVNCHIYVLSLWSINAFHFLYCAKNITHFYTLLDFIQSDNVIYFTTIKQFKEKFLFEVYILKHSV